MGVEEGVREEGDGGARGGKKVQGESDGGAGASGVEESEDGKVVRKMEKSEKMEGGWNPMGLRGDDMRIAMFFLFFVQVGFFGTGK